MYLDEKKFEKSREAFTQGHRRAQRFAPHIYLRGKASVGLNDFAGAIPDLEIAVRSEPQIRLLTALPESSQMPTRVPETMRRADAMFAEPIQFYQHAGDALQLRKVLKLAEETMRQNNGADAHGKERTLPALTCSANELSWFRKGKALIKELNEKKAP